MNCPVDGTELRMTDRQGVEIDYCPTCRGIWLDRGELDKIIERSGQASYPDEPDNVTEQGRDHDSSGRGYGKRKKRRSLLGDLLDFG